MSDILLRTTLFAAEKHRAQRRKDSTNTPYINHPISVANILANSGGITNIEILQAALLHDTIEDTKTTFNELRETFGESVAQIVSEVTDDKSLPKEKRKQYQVEHTASISDAAKLVKMADKIDNLRGLVHEPIWDAERVQGYFIWSRAVLASCKGLNPELERILDELFSEIPPDEDGILLEKYYQNMKVVNN